MVTEAERRSITTLTQLRQSQQQEQRISQEQQQFQQQQEDQIRLQQEQQQSQEEQQQKIQEAIELLETQIKRSPAGTSVSSRMRKVGEAFERAGLGRRTGERLYYERIIGELTEEEYQQNLAAKLQKREGVITTATMTTIEPQRLAGVIVSDVIREKPSSAYTYANLKGTVKDIASQFVNPRYFLEDVSKQAKKYTTLEIGKAFGEKAGERAGKIAGVAAPIGLYFTPLFPALITGGGIEAVSTVRGATPEQKEFKSYIESFEKKTDDRGAVYYESPAGALTEQEYESMKKQYKLTRVLGGVTLAASAFYLGAKGYEFATKPVILKTINPATGRLAKTFQFYKEQFFSKRSMTPVKEGQAGVIKGYQYRPASYQYQTTGLKQLFGVIPKEPVKVSKAGFYAITKGAKGTGVVYSKPTTDILGEQVSRTMNRPIYFRQKITPAGKPIGKVKYGFVQRGEIKELSPEAIQKIYKTGKPFEKQLVGDVLVAREGDKFYIKYLETTKLGKFTQKPKEVVWTLPKKGAVTERAQSFEIVKPLYETEKANVYVFEENIRKISESPRKLWIVPKGYGETILFKEPYQIPSAEKMVIKPSTDFVSAAQQIFKTETPQKAAQVSLQRTIAASVPVPKASAPVIPAVTQTVKTTQITTPLVIGAVSQIPKTMEKQIAIPISLEKTIPSTATTQISLPFLRVSPAQITLPSQATQQSVIQVQVPQQLQIASSVISIPKVEIPTPSAPAIRIPLLKPPTTSQLKSRTQRILGKGYKTFYYLKGRKRFLSGVSTRSEAIKRGETQVLKSISARFGIEETEIPAGKDILDYKPREQIFRGYKIKGRMRIPLQDEWIQKAGTRREPTTRGARLGRRSEVRELLSFRKSRTGGLFR